MVDGYRHDRGADGEVLDDVASPTVIVLSNPGPHDSVRVFGFRLGLHAGQGQFPCVIKRLREILHLDIASRSFQRGAQTLMGDVIDAGTHHEGGGPVACLEQRPEILSREVRGKWPVMNRAVVSAVAVFDRGADRHELSEVFAPLLQGDFEPNTNDAIGPEDIVPALDALGGAPSTSESVVRGYKVKVTRQDLSPAEVANRRKAVAEVIARGLGR